MKTYHVPLTFFADFMDAVYPILLDAQRCRAGGSPASVLAQFSFADFDANEPKKKLTYGPLREGEPTERRMIELKLCLVPATAVERVHQTIEKARAKMAASAADAAPEISNETATTPTPP